MLRNANCSFLSSLIVVLFLQSSSLSVFAQDEPPGYKHLQPIESFVGVWKARFDPPGDVPEGDLEIEFKWQCNKSYIQMDVEFSPNGRDSKLNPEFMVVGYEQKERATKAWHFKYLVQGRTDAKISRDQLLIEQYEGNPGESKYRMQKKLFRLDGNELIISESMEEGDSGLIKKPDVRLQRAG